MTEKSERALGKERFIMMLQEEDYIINRFLLWGGIVMTLIVSIVLTFFLTLIRL